MTRAATETLVDAGRVVRVTMVRLPHMSNSCFHHCEKSLVGLVLLTLVRTSEALAAEQTPLAINAGKPDFAASLQPITLSAMLPIPAPYQAGGLTESKTYSTRDFRPRGRSILDRDNREDVGDPPLIARTTVWQRLAEYRSHDRVRLVTLWETSGSSVSLQAGKRGDPSLQWTSRLMNRGGATRGVFDELFSTSIGGFGRAMHLAPRSSGSESSIKPSKLSEAALGGARAP
jgi:hypothetical protein